MRITEVRVTHIDDADDRLRAFCSITFDDSFVVRDLKIIDGANGLFVAMPSRRVSVHCNGCGAKNFSRASYCNDCGSRLPAKGASDDGNGDKLYVDVAHPINKSCREMIQSRVIEQFMSERAIASEPSVNGS